MQAVNKNCELDEAVKAAIIQGVMRAVNRLHPDFEEILAEKPQKNEEKSPCAGDRRRRKVRC